VQHPHPLPFVPPRAHIEPVLDAASMFSVVVGVAVNVWIVVVAASAAIVALLLLALVAVALDSRGEPPFRPFPLQVLDK
jgi:hypothetical protein